MKVSSLKKNPNNPRQIRGEKLELLKKSVGSFQKMMELRPIVVDENSVVLGGNMRLAAIKALGLKDIPDEWVKKADDLTEDEKREFIIKDNAGFGEWDWDTLANEWDAAELTDWGLHVPDYEAIDAIGDADAEPQIDKAAELNKKWKVKSGDLWQIGSHRLICGDSTDAGHVSRLMAGERAELLFTSPPYSDQRDYDGDDTSVEHLVNSVPAFADVAAYQVINLGIKRKDREIVEYWQEYIIEARSCGYKFLSWNVWDKKECGSIGNQSAMFGIRHEWLFVFGEYKKLNRTVANKSAGDRANHTGNRQADGTIKKGWDGLVGQRRQLDTVIEQTAHKARNLEVDHPAMYPVDLPTAYIEAMTDKGQNVCEPFAGSGTTLVACQNLNRKCYAIEISENYCAVILERMQTAFPDIEIKRLDHEKSLEQSNGTTI